MSSIGPSLPPHLTKRKRTPDDNADGSPPPKLARNADEIDLDDGSSDDGYGPGASAAAAASVAPEERPAVGPTLPPSAASKSNQDEIDLDDSDDDYGPSAAHPQPATGPSAPSKRTIGPSMPPSGAAASADFSDSEDDDYGPALPSADTDVPQTSIFDRPSANPTAHQPAPSKRDDWMLAPPTSSGYQERDPTKLKNRRFASSKPHAPGPSGGPSEISSIWTETPEQKRKRLEDAVLGRAAPAGSDLEAAQNQTRHGPGRANDERHRRTAENLAATKGKSLYEQHQESRNQGRKDGKDVEEEDDPSKRAFDREKDMAVGGALSADQKRMLLSKNKDMGSRFQKGSYL